MRGKCCGLSLRRSYADSSWGIEGELKKKSDRGGGKILSLSDFRFYCSAWTVFLICPASDPILLIQFFAVLGIGCDLYDQVVFIFFAEEKDQSAVTVRSTLLTDFFPFLASFF